MDAKRIGLSTLESVQRFRPNDEQLPLLKALEDKEPDTVAEADKFLIQLSKIPLLEQRVEALLLELQFEDLYKELIPVCFTVCCSVLWTFASLASLHSSTDMNALILYILPRMD